MPSTTRTRHEPCLLVSAGPHAGGGQTPRDSHCTLAQTALRELEESRAASAVRA
jgi:hypothetical protein